MISNLLFERLWFLLLVLVTIQFLFICIWSWQRSPLSARLVWGGFAAIPILGAINYFVKTPQEQVIGTCIHIAKLVEEADVNAIDYYLAEDVEVEGRNKRKLLERLAAELTQRRIEKPRLSAFSVEKVGDDFEVVFDSSCRVRPSPVVMDRLLCRWRLRFGRSENGWLVRSIETLPSPFSPIGALRDLLP